MIFNTFSYNSAQIQTSLKRLTKAYIAQIHQNPINPKVAKMQPKPLKIAYYRNLFVGDSIIALDSLLAIKELYPNAYLSVFTGDIGERIFSSFDFINEVINIQNLSRDEVISRLDSSAFDYLILTQPNRRHTSIANASNAKCVISFAMWHNLFLRAFGKREFRRAFYGRAFGDTPNYQRLLHLVRLIDKTHYDSQTIDFSKARFPLSAKHRDFVESKLSFLRQSAQNPQPCHKILLNPYSNSCAMSLTLEGYAELANTLAKKLPNAQIIISSFEYANPLPNLENLPNIHIFTNNGDLWNLIELMRKMDLVISPSTGPIHIADNLGIPIIGIYNKTDMRLWLGKNMDKNLMIISKIPTSKLRTNQQNQLIAQISQKVLALFG